MATSWKVEIRAKGETGFFTNSIRLPNEEQAKQYASDLYSKWMQAEEYRVVESNDPVNHYVYDGYKLAQVPEFYKRIAEALKASITDVYDESDESDAGASFSTGHDIQISHYMDEAFTLNHMDDETFTQLFSSATEDEVINYITKNITKEVTK